MTSIAVILIEERCNEIEFEYEILDEVAEVLTTANTVLAFINMETKRPTRCPQFILDKLQN